MALVKDPTEVRIVEDTADDRLIELGETLADEFKDDDAVCIYVHDHSVSIFIEECVTPAQMRIIQNYCEWATYGGDPVRSMSGMQILPYSDQISMHVQPKGHDRYE